MRGLVAIIKSFLNFKQNLIITCAPKQIFGWTELKSMLQLTTFLPEAARLCTDGGWDPAVPPFLFTGSREWDPTALHLCSPHPMGKGWKLPSCHPLQALVVLLASPSSLFQRGRLLPPSSPSFAPSAHSWPACARFVPSWALLWLNQLSLVLGV